MNNYYVMYIKHPVSVTVLERINDSPSCDIDMFEDIVKLVKALDDLTYQKNKELAKRIEKLCAEIHFSTSVYSTYDFVKKIVEVRNSESHAREIKQNKVSMSEIRNLYYDTRKLFINYLKRELLK